MDIDLGLLTIKQVAIHEVPQTGSASGAILTDAECDLDDTMRNYFSERLRTSLASAAHDVVPNDAITSVVPSLLRDVLDGKTSLLAASRDLAGALFLGQTHVNTPGLLATSLVTLGSGQGVAILKLEKETGMRGELQDQEGLRIFTVDMIRNLFFTDKTRVFKAAVFGKAGSSVEGKVSDQQSSAVSLDVAQFFLRFLGCKYAIAPETSTRDFFEAAQDFVNEDISEALKKARYEMALLTELTSEHQQVQPRQFAAEYLAEEDRQTFVERLESVGVSPQPFRKDNRLIATKLQKVEYRFASGIKVLLPPGAIDSGTASVENLADGKTRLAVTDSLERMSGRS